MARWRKNNPNYMKDYYKKNPDQYDHLLELNRLNFKRIKRDAKKYRKLLDYQREKHRQYRAEGRI